jgi:hypothetical protein
MHFQVGRMMTPLLEMMIIYAAAGAGARLFVDYWAKLRQAPGVENEWP